MRKVALFVLALAGSASAQTVSNYALICTGGPCQAPDGTTQAAGTAVALLSWDGHRAVTEGTNQQLVPYTGQAIYQTPAPAQSIAQQAQAELAGGLTVTSTSTPAINGTYAADQMTQGNVQAELLSVLVNNTFTNGTTTFPWPDMAGAPHTVTIAQFKALATAEGAFVGALKAAITSNSGTVPSAEVTIP